MRSVKHIYLFTTSFLFLMFVFPIQIFAGGAGHGGSDSLMGKISSEGVVGLNLWFINLYNDHRLLFALVTLFTMGIIGMSIAFITEYFLRIFGFETTKMDHKE